MKFVKQHRALAVLLTAALLLGIWSAWYSRPRTLEQLAPGFRWDEVNKVDLCSFYATYPPTLPSGVDTRQFALPQRITLSPEELADWQEATFRRKPLATLQYRWDAFATYVVNRRNPVYYRYYLYLSTDAGEMIIEVFHKRLTVQWFSRDALSNAGPWVLTPPDGLLTATGASFLPYAVQIEDD